MAEKRKIMVEMTLEELLSFQLYLKEKREKTNPLKNASISELIFELASRIPPKDRKRTFDTDVASNRGIAIEEGHMFLGNNGEFEYKLITREEK